MLSLAFLFTPAFSASLESLPPQLYSHGSATIATLQQVAGAGGTAIFIALYATGLAGVGGIDSEVPTAVEAAAGGHVAFVVGGLLSLGAIVLNLLVRRSGATRAY